jgi:integrase
VSVYRKQFTKPLPAGAEITQRSRKPTAQEREVDPALREVVEQIARWRDKTGKLRTDVVTTGRDGEPRIKQFSSTYVAQYRDHEGRVRVVPTNARTESGARAVLAELKRRTERVLVGIVSPAEQRAAAFQSDPIGEHVAAFVEQKRTRGLNAEVVKNTQRRLERIALDCGFSRLADLDPNKFERWLAEQAAAGMTPSNRNEYRKELVGFGNWLVKTRRLNSNPFGAVPKADTSTPARRRRALTMGEVARLLKAAALRPLAELGKISVRVEPLAGRSTKRANWKYVDLRFDDLQAAADRAKERHADNPALLAEAERTGRERRLIYLFLVSTGLRLNELRQLTVGQLQLNTDRPCFHLEAGQAKSRKSATLPLRADVAAELRQWLADRAAARQLAASEAAAVRFDPQAARRSNAATDRKRAEPLPSGERLFNVVDGLLRIFDRDLEAAEIPKQDDRGRTIDLHGLRTTFGTMLAKSGTGVRTAQSAMRHATPTLTMGVYVDSALLDVAAAVEALPGFADPDPARRKSTG